MSSADLCQVNGLGLSFQVSAQLRRSAARSLTVRWAERCSFLVVSAENHRSTRWVRDAARRLVAWIDHLAEQSHRCLLDQHIPPAVPVGLERARKDQRVGQIARGPTPPLLCPQHVSRCKLLDRPIVCKAVSDQRVISGVWGGEVFAATRVDGHQHPVVVGTKP